MENIKPPETLKDFQEIRKTLLGLINNPYADQSMILSCTDKLRRVDEKIELLKQVIK